MASRNTPGERREGSDYKERSRLRARERPRWHEEQGRALDGDNDVRASDGDNDVEKEDRQ